MMKYVNDTVRRQDRLLSEEKARKLLDTAEYGVLSMTDTDGRPYGVPVNYVWDGQQRLYIHCAPEGRKLRALEQNPAVSFCVVGRVHLLPNKFTTEYESVILEGTAHLNLSNEEKTAALRLLLEKLSPDDKEVGMKYARNSFHRVELIRIDLTVFSGKCKVVK